MKRFGEIFISVNRYLIEFNSYSEDIINTVCDSIRDSFTIGKWKEQE